ncbi:type II toxin-antitoxin system VapB family antitoxin [Thermosynechococcaceae cyanobacterium BACA0444]|uniref:Type II toxin-antitoxin system VapB family antitoxin n=1 Tax=Pseudocalidococcus azoricus BACA0444 TaxID=2918990 RepID=A0AAE4FU08_9CYAN|nr:type II toxin-antitoxin system VapB family antitoxin [Pseudocalidococcus azoricus]MDS3861562.1 type II toxin-antitoxin system VapB family antitoxin [Pseudocalidococcus azoricus BACA0444]
MVVSKIFTSNRSQAVRLPADVRFDESVKKVTIRVNGKERIIAPVDAVWDSFFLDGPVASDDFLNERPSQEQAERMPL